MIFLATFASVVLLAQSKGPGWELNEQGLAAMDRGEPAEAVKLFEQGLEVWRGMGPQFEPHLATTLFNMGEALCTAGRWREGVAAFEQALEMNRRTLGPQNHRSVLGANALASAYLLLGEVDRAEQLYNEALVVERELYTNDLQYARTLMGISNLRSRAGKPDEALPPAEAALSVAIRVTGENSTDTAMAYGNVAQIYRLLKRPERALPLFRKAIAIYEAKLKPGDSRIASMLSQEAIALMQDGKLVEAEKNMNRSLAMLEQCGGCDFQLSIAQSNLGMLRLRQGKYKEADRLLTGALALQEKLVMRPGNEIAATLQNLSEVRTKQRRFDEAEQLRDRAKTILSFK